MIQLPPFRVWHGQSRCVSIALAVVMSALCVLAMSSQQIKTRERTLHPTLVWHARKPSLHATLSLRQGRLAAAAPIAYERRLEDTCGHFWHSSYTKHHRNILAGVGPAKYAVSLGVEAGLADRLVGTFSIFFFALLSGRAFQIAAYPGVVDFQEALEPAHIDWSRAEVDERVIQNIK